MIKLCYVQGISEVDTPWFDSKEVQTAYFDKHVIWVDDTSYYPPYFMNTIRLSSDDIPFNDSSKKVNYCILEYDGKDYYYFIDSIDYVTDDLVEVTIEMDTIQTYLFDMRFNKAVISRMPILRWGDDGKSINRNYVRENLSTGNMIKRLKEEFKGTTDKLQWIVARISSDPTASHYDPNHDSTHEYLQSASYGHVRYKKDANHVIDYQMTGGGYLLVPYGDWVAEAGKVWVKFGTTYKLIADLPEFLASLASDSRVMAMSFIPFNPFADIHYTGLTHTDGNTKAPVIEVLNHGITINTTDAESKPITVNLTWYYYQLGSTASSASKYGYLRMVFPEDYNNRTESFTEAPAVELIPNSKSMALDSYVGGKVTTKTTIWNPANVPAMLDENYLQVHLGDNGGTTIAPLFYYVIPSLSMDEWATLDGNMAYSIASPNVLGIDYGGAIIDMNNTALMNENALTFDLYTDPWKNYQVTHKGSLVTDWIATGANSVAKIAGVTSLAEATMGRSKGTSPMSYNDMGLSVGDYVTGFVPYRKHVYSTRERDPKTGRFVRNDIFTYTGGL